VSFIPSDYGHIESAYAGTPYSPSFFGPTPAVATASPGTEAAATPEAEEAPAEEVSKWTALAQLGGMLGGGLISTVAASDQAKKQAATDLRMAKQQGKLLNLQTKASGAAAAASSAQALIQSFATRNTLYIVGGLITAVVVIAGTVYLLKGQKDAPAESDGESEEEE
jgi:hypothetical protein